MISLTQLLSRKIKDKGPEEEKYIDHILSNGYQMNELIQGILDIAKIEKQETLILKEIDLNEVFNKVKSNFSSRLTAKKVVLEAENLPIILANEAQVIQLFQNLIENGIKYNRSETPKIVITQKREDKFLNLYFTDNGIGIAPQYFDKIFEMFKRLHSGYEFKGTGIGLAICKKIALRHKGDLTVENSSDAGTVFKLSLPI
jgi:light-regulated signal transduction histidine kinase (bacteriophytochrome)